MAKGSENISVRGLQGAKRECWVCGKKITNLAKDVGEVRTRFPGAIREIKCMDCHLASARRKDERSP